MGKRIHQLRRTQLIRRPHEEVFAFFADASHLQELTPPFLNFHILTPLPVVMTTGVQLDYSLRLFGLPFSWRTRITLWQPNESFVDEQETGPYAFWRHTHTFEAVGSNTVMHDLVEYAEPFGPIGKIAHRFVVKQTLDRIFNFRRDATFRLLDVSEDRPASKSSVATKA